jgi:hypothetical protein
MRYFTINRLKQEYLMGVKSKHQAIISGHTLYDADNLDPLTLNY